MTKKQSLARKMEWQRPGYKEKMRTIHKKRLQNPENHPMYGKKQTEKTKKKIRESQKKRLENSKVRKKMSKSIEKLWQNLEYRKKQSEAHKGNTSWNKNIPCSKKTKEKLSRKAKQNWQESKYDGETRKKYSKTSKENWQKGVMDGIFQSPTKPEKEIMRILESLGIDYIFQFRPKGYSKLYDFYIPKLNLLIEYDSKYWHSLPGMKERDTEKTQYAINNGYKLLRINKKI